MPRQPTPAVESFDLDAYGHLSYVVGWSDEWREDVTELEVIAKAASGDLTDEEIENEAQDVDMGDRGDWLACVDIDRRGDWVGYHVVVNSDSGGFIDTIEQGVLTVAEARDQLPGLLETYDDVGSEHLVNDGQWYTKEERGECLAAVKRWKQHVEELTR
jgi:hypothetical protein